jgi:IclR family acetate operon transcriptional repressor
MAPDSSPGPTGDTGSGTVARVVAVMRVMAEAAAPIGIRDLEAALGLPKSTCHRLLELLIEQGFVERADDGRRYVIGIEWYRLSSLTAERHSITDVAAPLLARLTQAADETAILGLHIPMRHVLIFGAKSDSAQPLRYHLDLNVPMPLVWGATSHAVLAYLEPDQIEAAFAAAVPSPVGAIPFDRAALEARLEKVRRLGYATSAGEKLAGARGIAVPFFIRPGVVKGCVAYTMPDIRYDSAREPELVALLKDAAAELSGRGGAP